MLEGPKYRSMLCIFALVTAFAAGCSSDDGNGGSTADDVGADVEMDVVSDVRQDDTDSMDIGDDVREDSGAEDVVEDSGTADGSDGSGTDEDGGDTGGGEIAAGEPCPSDCGAGGGAAGGTDCAACRGDVCFERYVGADPYCSRECETDADCEDLGEEWSCGTMYGYCERQ